jgi:hypothetical protein
MSDEILTDLIAAIVAARADGDGALTIAAVRARLDAAKLRVERVKAASELNPLPYDDDENDFTRMRDVLSRQSLKRFRTQQSGGEQRPHLCRDGGLGLYPKFERVIRWIKRQS